MENFKLKFRVVKSANGIPPEILRVQKLLGFKPGEAVTRENFQKLSFRNVKKIAMESSGLSEETKSEKKDLPNAAAKLSSQNLNDKENIELKPENFTASVNKLATESTDCRREMKSVQKMALPLPAENDSLKKFGKKENKESEQKMLPCNANEKTSKNLETEENIKQCPVPLSAKQKALSNWGKSGNKMFEMNVVPLPENQTFKKQRRTKLVDLRKIKIIKKLGGKKTEE